MNRNPQPLASARVAITGVGFITPIGNDWATVQTSLRVLKHGLIPVDWARGAEMHLVGGNPDFDLSDLNALLWKWPDSYDIPRQVLRGLSPHGVYALCAVEQALNQSELTTQNIRADERTGLFCASAGSPRYTTHHVNEALNSGGRKIHPWSVMRAISGTLNFNLAAHFGIQGAVTGFASACSSSGHALGYAHDEITLGRHDRVIVVGAEEPVPESLLPFAGARVTSRQSDPTKASRPFDIDRDGFVGAGGAVALILENLTVAQARGARPLALLKGWGQSADGYQVAQPEPEGRAVSAAMRRALTNADIAPSEVDYINAHATSTQAGDRAEARAITRVFGEQTVPVSGTKALTGHPLSMSSAMEAAICTLAIKEQFIPGQAHLQNLDPDCASLRIPRKSEAAKLRHVLSNSSAFGGSNVSLVLSAY
jgi:3-oxoacyl-[acyl-carrier-protein] synthase I